jgi:hypothetical protein
MGVQQRRFVLLAALAAAATPAFGQAITPPARTAGSGPQGAASIPDFSGIWAHPSFPGFEPPASGPGPVVNKARRPQTFNAEGRPVPATSGVRVSNFGRLVGDYASPILKPQSAEVVKKHGEISLSGATYPTPTNQCWPEPVPYILASIAVRMLQQPDKITFLYPNDHQVRYVRMNQPHPAQVTPTPSRWERLAPGSTTGVRQVVATIDVARAKPATGILSVTRRRGRRRWLRTLVRQHGQHDFPRGRRQDLAGGRDRGRAGR